MTQNELHVLQRASLDGCDPGSLTDISTISIDRAQSVSQRVTSFLNAVGNPYLFRVGEVVVKVRFDPSGKRFSDAISDAFRSC